MGNWTDEEIGILKSSSDISGNISHLALILNRKEHAIISKASKLGLLKSPFWTDEQIQLLIDAGPNLREKANEIAKTIGKSRDCVTLKARKLGLIDTIELNNHIWTKEDNDIIKTHLGKIPSKEIQRLYFPDLKPKVISSHIKRMGWKANNKHFNAIYTYNHSFFSEVNLLSSYWAGFVAADGCVLNLGQEHHVLAFKLSQKDHQHLETFKEDIEYTGKVHKDFRSYQNSSNLRINIRPETVRNLQDNFNIGPRKTFDLIPPNIEDLDLKCAFLKGFIDGDGCISYLQRGPNNHIMSLVLVGTYEMMVWAQELTREIADVQCRKKILKTENIWRYENNRYDTLAPVLQKLNQLDTPALDRKWSKVDKYLHLTVPKWRHPNPRTGDRNVTT